MSRFLFFFILLLGLTPKLIGQTMVGDIELKIEHSHVISLNIPASDTPRSIEVYKMHEDGSLDSKGTTINTYRKPVKSSWVAKPGNYIIRVYRLEGQNKSQIIETTFVVEPSMANR